MKFHGKVVFNREGLDALREELKKANTVHVRIGVLGDEAARDGEGDINNAQLGAVHELGSKSGQIPPRSFLRVPCLEDLPSKIHPLKKKLAKVFVDKGAVECFKRVGVLAEQAVDDAFDTAGKGRWAPNKPATIRKKGSARPLINSGKLRRSVTSKVYVGDKEASK